MPRFDMDAVFFQCFWVAETKKSPMQSLHRARSRRDRRVLPGSASGQGDAPVMHRLFFPSCEQLFFCSLNQ